jgi:LPPG:FO 2-phospho-L-lactate transferase
MKVVALAGGVGGAKLADGLAQVLPPEDFTVIVNIGDDFDFLGLRICPDLDTVCYTLAGMANPETGWGRAGETWRFMEALTRLAGPDWFQLGDKDLATHIERTRRLASGHPLSRITADFCRSWSIRHTVLPVSDQPVPTIVLTSDGELPFQEYFVARRCEPVVAGFRFEGIANAVPALGVLDSLHHSDLVIICPSNPWVSIDPILAFPSIRSALEKKPVIAVSPILGGQTIKGPAAKMYTELGISPSVLAVARHYTPLLSGFVIDDIDREYNDDLRLAGLDVLVTDTIMRSSADRVRLAQEVIEFTVKNLGISKS